MFSSVLVPACRAIPSTLPPMFSSVLIPACRAIPSTLPPMFSSVLIPACPCHSFYIASNVLLCIDSSVPCHSFYIASNVLLCIDSSVPVPFLLHCLQCSPLYWFQRARAIPSTLPPMFSSVLIPASSCHSFYIASNVLTCIASSEPVPVLPYIQYIDCLQY